MAEDKDKKKKKITGFKEFDPSKYIDTEPRIDEAAMKDVAVVSFGRMNPITVGHEKLAMKVMSEASKRKADPHIFLSHSSDAKKNPLSYEDKLKFAKKAFGSVVKSSPARTIIEVAKSLSGKYKNLIIVVGQDRIEEFKSLLTRYNNKEYNFENIDIVSAGARDPDAEGVEGMSASKMRSLAQTGDLKTFTSGLPKKLKSSAKEVYDAVRKGMGMNEELEEELDEALTRAQRIQRSRIMKRARFKILRGKERAERKTAPMSVLRKRARKDALKFLKKKFTKSRDYEELSAGEKEVIDKRIEKLSPRVIASIARKLLPSVRKRDRERLAAHRSSTTEDLNQKFESFLSEASQLDTQFRQRPHMLIGKDMKTKIDKRFKIFKNKVNESSEDLVEDLVDFTLDMDSYIDSLDEVAISATKKPVNVKGPDGRTRTVWRRTRSVNRDEHGQDKISTNEDYYKGVPKDKKDDRKAHFKRYAEKPGDGADKDSNYKPAPGDFKDGERVKTKLSKHTQKYRQMYGESEISEDATTSLKKKSEKTGMPLSVLRKVYNRGIAAWKSGHRPGTTPEQWAHARVNSFVTKSSGTWGGADKDLASKVRKEETVVEEGGAGDWGTPKLTKKFKKDTPSE